MEFYCYIIYSPSIDKFYTGETQDLSERINLHNSGYFAGTFTKQASDWELYLSIPCKDRIQARQIEKHIKSMKSKKYIENLKEYPEMVTKLIDKYS